MKRAREVINQYPRESLNMGRLSSPTVSSEEEIKLPSKIMIAIGALPPGFEPKQLA